MRAIVGLACLLLGFGLLSCQLEGVAEVAASAPPELRWVRTADGWERPATWQAEPSQSPRLHPLVVAAGQGLASVLGLVAFSGRRGVGTRRGR